MIPQKLSFNSQSYTKNIIQMENRTS